MQLYQIHYHFAVASCNFNAITIGIFRNYPHTQQIVKI